MEDQILFYTLKTESINQEERIMPTYQQHPSSFRDPSGFVFESAGKLYRQINASYAEDYDLLMQSGLYKLLTERGWLITHEEVDLHVANATGGYKTILPQFVPFIAYPYEWCFEQLQDAAILTLQILKSAIDHGMILKDASPYNIQFRFGIPIQIDTLSFQKYDERQPWIAYRQFCECFLYPLLVAKYTGLETHRLFMAYPQGIPARVAAGLLPLKSRFTLSNWLHVFLAASVSKPGQQKETDFNKSKLLRIILHLESIITALKPRVKNKSVWDHYYEEEILNDQYLNDKKEIVKRMVTGQDKNIIDLGCNRGLFSQLLSGPGKNIVAVDDNAYSISKLYTSAREKQNRILPLCIDLMNPPGDAGFGNKERKVFFERMRFDLCLCLALVHHLCIGRNVPFENLAAFLGRVADRLIIEFIPKEDAKVQLILLSRKDIFPQYDQQNFESAFKKFFQLEDSKQIQGSKRVVYRMKTK